MTSTKPIREIDSANTVALADVRTSPKVLVLGEGMTHFLAVLRSLGRKGIEVHTAWGDPDCPALQSRYMAKAHDVPFCSADGDWKRAFADLLVRERFDLVIPTNEQTMRPLQRHREEFAGLAPIYLLSDRQFEVLFDKQKTVELARSLGVPIPRSELVVDLDGCRRIAAEFGWPVVLKPLSSFTDAELLLRRSVVRAYNDEELEGAARRLLPKGPLLVQECFIGRGVGVELLAHKGKSLVEFQHERVHLPPRGGASTYRKSVPLSPELVEAARKIVESLQYTGVLMVEFLVNSQTGEWRFVETNARFWGSLPLAIAAGVDFPTYLFQMLRNGRREFPKSYRPGLYCRNLTADLHWAHDNFRADRDDPTLMTVSLGQVVREWGNVALLRERSDTLVADDPWPGVVELGQFVRQNSAKLIRRTIGRMAQALLGNRALRRRASIRARAALESANSVEFVCLGNICRSPFAEHYARRVLPAHVEVRSSGLYRRPNRPSPAPAVTVAAEMGIDQSRHGADVLTAEAVARADVIFSFDESVHQEIRRRFPAARRKLHRFALLAEQGSLDVPDPFGGTLDRFRAVYRRIASLLDSVATAPNAASTECRRPQDDSSERATRSEPSNNKGEMPLADKGEMPLAAVVASAELGPSALWSMRTSREAAT